MLSALTLPFLNDHVLKHHDVRAATAFPTTHIDISRPHAGAGKLRHHLAPTVTFQVGLPNAPFLPVHSAAAPERSRSLG